MITVVLKTKYHYMLYYWHK